MSDESDRALPETKLTTTKQRWAREGKFLTGRVTRPESERLPPGQHLVKDWPVLDLGIQPTVARETWRLDVTGAVDNPVSWDWQTFLAQPQSRETTDIHCVTTWSRYDNGWEGVLTRDLLAIVEPKAEARFVMLHSYDGYTTNLPLEDFAAEDAILAQPEIILGIIPGDGGTQRLTRVVGKSLAMKMILTGEPISAREAQQAGLVAEVLPAAAVVDRALALAALISTRAPVAARLAKEAVLAAYETTLSAGLETERRAIRLAFTTEDQKEGMAAFAEKRPARFQGR